MKKHEDIICKSTISGYWSEEITYTSIYNLQILTRRHPQYTDIDQKILLISPQFVDTDLKILLMNPHFVDIVLKILLVSTQFVDTGLKMFLISPQFVDIDLKIFLVKSPICGYVIDKSTVCGYGSEDIFYMLTYVDIDLKILLLCPQFVDIDLKLFNLYKFDFSLIEWNIGRLYLIQKTNGMPHEIDKPIPYCLKPFKDTKFCT